MWPTGKTGPFDDEDRDVSPALEVLPASSTPSRPTAFDPVARQHRLHDAVRRAPRIAHVTGTLKGDERGRDVQPLGRLRDRPLGQRLVPARTRPPELESRAVSTLPLRRRRAAPAARDRRARASSAMRVVAVDRNPDAPGLAEADVGEVVDFTDVDGGDSRSARRHAVDGVLTVSADRAVPIVAAVAEASRPAGDRHRGRSRADAQGRDAARVRRGRRAAAALRGGAHAARGPRRASRPSGSRRC